MRHAGVSDASGARPADASSPLTVAPPIRLQRVRLHPSRLGGGLPLALAFTAMFASAPGQSFVFAVFIDHILVGTEMSRTVFSGLYAAATIVSATLSLGLGHAADRVGVRVVWTIVAVGLAAACLLESFAQGIVLTAVGVALLRSFGQGSFPLLGTLVVNHWFARRRGAAMATASFGLTLASVALPPLLALLIAGVGWRTSYRLVALVLVLGVLPLAALVRTPAARASSRATDVPPPDVPSPRVVRRVGRRRLPIPERSAALLLVALSTPGLVTTAITFHAVSLLGGRGIDAPAAAAALSVLGLAAAGGTLAAGALADRLTTRALAATVTTATLAGSAILLAPSGPTSYVAFAVLGFGNGIWGVVSGIVWARTYGLAGLGRIQGLAFAASIVGAAVGPLPLAVSQAATGTYAAGLLFLLATATTALAAALRWRPPDRRSLT